jgi:cell division protein FtsZ
VPNGRQRGGFNPDRLADLTRPVQVVPQIMDAPQESQARGFTEVKIIGVGGGGSNAVNRMIETGVQGVEFIAINTDAQALQMSTAVRKLPIGGRATKGLGAGGDPLQGERAAEISRDALIESVEGADMVFLTAGLGGGTGTGAAPIIADIARRARALTVAVVTLPFTFEGARRRRAAEEGLDRLRSNVDALIVIPNDRLLDLADRQMSVVEAFHLADDVLRHGVQGISDLVTMTGLINLDFADVKAVMQNAGTALMAVGEGHGEGRAVVAARAAISSPLLDVSIDGATGVLMNISGGPDLTLSEVTEAAETIQAAVDPDANIYFGAVVHPRVQDEVRVTVIATGLQPGGRLSAPRRATYTSTEPGLVESVAEPQPTRERISPPPRDREPDWTPERRRPGPTEWERAPRQPARGTTEWDRDRDRPRAEPSGEDDFDTPAFLRRPRR